MKGMMMNDWILELRARIEMEQRQYDSALLEFIRIGLVNGYLCLGDFNGKTHDEAYGTATHIYNKVTESNDAHWDYDVAAFETAYKSMTICNHRLITIKRRLEFLLKHQDEEV